MSNQGYYNQGPPAQGNQQPQSLQSNNPFSNQQQQQYQPPPQQQQQYQPPPQQQQQQQTSYNTPAGGFAPPPGPPPRRSETFQETDFVPASERSEQREAMEQYEINRSKPESAVDRDVATLQSEFPSVDGSLIAAIYGDSSSLSATREMLRELSSQN